MYKDIFINISNHLKTNIAWVKSVDLYFQQDSNPEKNLGYKSPYIMIDFQNIQFSNMSNGIQEGTMDVIVRILIENYTRNRLEVFDYRNDVVNCLYNFAPEQFSLQHLREQTNSSATNQYMFEITFSCNFYEDLSYIYEEIGGDTGKVLQFNLQLMMDRFNTEILPIAGTSGVSVENIQGELITDAINISFLLDDNNFDINGDYTGPYISQAKGDFYVSVSYFYFFKDANTPLRTLKG
jgi:hypothetical protein